jgi:hypothetical protein
MPKPDRRSRDRRISLKVVESLERHRQRRIGERRDSPRLRKTLEIPSNEGPIAVCDGDISLGGVRYRTAFPPRRGTIEVRFRLPDVLTEVSAIARVVRTRNDGAFTEVHARFVDMDLKDELALARFLETRSQLYQEIDDARRAAASEAS